MNSEDKKKCLEKINELQEKRKRLMKQYFEMLMDPKYQQIIEKENQRQMNNKKLQELNQKLEGKQRDFNQKDLQWKQRNRGKPEPFISVRDKSAGERKLDEMSNKNLNVVPSVGPNPNPKPVNTIVQPINQTINQPIDNQIDQQYNSPINQLYQELSPREKINQSEPINPLTHSVAARNAKSYPIQQLQQMNDYNSNQPIVSQINNIQQTQQIPQIQTDQNNFNQSIVSQSNNVEKTVSPTTNQLPLMINGSQNDIKVTPLNFNSPMSINVQPSINSNGNQLNNYPQMLNAQSIYQNNQHQPMNNPINLQQPMNGNKISPMNNPINFQQPIQLNNNYGQWSITPLT